MTQAPPAPLTKKKLLICEGAEERALVEEMMRVGRCPTLDVSVIGAPGAGTGIGGLRQHLVALPGLSGFSKVTDIGIFADHDAHPHMMNSIISDITTANNHAALNGRLSSPTADYKKATNSPISVTLIMSPGPGMSGCLETLLLKVLAKNHSAKMSCVDTLVQCAGIDTGPSAWSQSKLDKARVRSAVAVILKKNPALTLSWLWREDPSIIPVIDTEFDALSKAFGQL